MKASEVYHYVLNLHLQAYVFAHKYIYNKKVIDAACGNCFGSMIFSTAAKSIIAVDKSKKAIDYGKKKLPFFCPMKFMVANLDKQKLPKADICVSVETIEHLSNSYFLDNLNVETLVYTTPINMPGEYHKVVFKSERDITEHLMKSGWVTKFYLVGDNDMFFGLAERNE